MGIQSTRRGFLKISGAGLALGMLAPVAAGSAAAESAAEPLVTPFLHLTPDGLLTVLSKHLEFGQGAATGLATLVAEELDANWDQVTVTHAPANAQLYANLAFGIQGTGGSTAIANSWEQYRQAGAVARAMIVAAAAEAWEVPAEEITISAGVVSHGQHRATLGELATAAAAQPVPSAASVRLKSREEWVHIGRHFPRLDSRTKTTGALGTYALDQQPEGKIVATLLKAPAFGGKLTGFELGEAANVKGFLDAVAIGDSAVAIFASSTWPALKAKGLIAAEWDLSAAETRSTTQMLEDYAAKLDEPGLPAGSRGDAVTAIANAVEVIEADYSFPFLAYGPMEPLNAIIQLKDEGVEVWTGSQLQTIDQMTLATMLGLTPDQVTLHTLFAGGSFGRRGTPDGHLVAEAVLTAQAWQAKTGERPPVHLVYSREDDITGGYYRPAYAHRVRVGLDSDGNIAGWQHRIVGQSIFTGTSFEGFLVHAGVDHSSVEGVVDTTYQLENLSVDVHNAQTPVPPLWWRSVGHTHTAYAMETMIERAVKAAGADPIDYRIGLFAPDAREVGVLRLLRQVTGGVGAAPQGRARGVAVHKSFNTYVAEMVELSVEDGAMKLHKVWCAVDCGVAVNPDMVRAQMEGGIGYGLGAVLRNKVTWEEGGVRNETNFDLYQPLRMSDMPEIETHIVLSDEAPTGVGEPGLPPLGPAIANAWFAATGEMITHLPFSDQGITS